MKVCYNCGSTQYIEVRVDDKDICEKCAIWYDYDEQIVGYEVLHDSYVEESGQWELVAV